MEFIDKSANTNDRIDAYVYSYNKDYITFKDTNFAITNLVTYQITEPRPLPQSRLKAAMIFFLGIFLLTFNSSVMLLPIY